jgi:hypothetical protein
MKVNEVRCQIALNSLLTLYKLSVIIDLSIENTPATRVGVRG